MFKFASFLSVLLYQAGFCLFSVAACKGSLSLSLETYTMSWPEGEMCVRFGGDEFLAVLVAKSSRRKNDFVKAFRSRLEKLSDMLGKPYRLGASIGICELEDGNTGQVIACMQNADRLMYEDKRSRQNAPGKDD